MPTPLRTARRVLLLEFNEITWTILDPMIARGLLPNFARLRIQGAWGAPEALEKPPYLDPWITWVTLHTGVERGVHGAAVLEQDAGTIGAKRTWSYVAEAGRSVGVFGSISAYPPPKVRGFVVPGPFAPGSETVPETLKPIQDLNRRYTQVHSRVASDGSLLAMLKEGAAIFRLGLRAGTAVRIVQQLALERLRPYMKWKRVSLQPLINYDLFAHLYEQYRPDYATFHTNHAAHYMHHYWRAMDDSRFPSRASAEEKAHYGGAVEYGYRICDELLGRFLASVDERTILVLTSSMGQQPYVNDLYPEGKIPVRFRDVRALLDIVGAQGVTEIVPTMVPQYNVRISDPVERGRVRDLLRAIRCEGGAHAKALSVEEVGPDLTLSPYGLAQRGNDVRYFFTGCANARPGGYPLEELFVCDAPTPKEGMHHPRGVLMFHGPGVPAGLEITNVSPLDIAPTILHLLGVPVPGVMQGRVLTEIAPELAPAAPPVSRKEPAIAQA
jgi:hypothetical protein